MKKSLMFGGALVLVAAGFALGAETKKIGRASCRERVWYYV